MNLLENNQRLHDVTQCDFYYREVGDFPKTAHPKNSRVFYSSFFFFFHHTNNFFF